MTDKKDKALKIALGYLDGTLVTQHITGYDRKRHVIESIREALAEQPVQQEHDPEWYHFIRFGEDCFVPYEGQAPSNATRLYRSPPASKPLTDEEIAIIAAACGGLASDFVVSVARAIEAAHGIKEKNNG